MGEDSKEVVRFFIGLGGCFEDGSALLGLIFLLHLNLRDENARRHRGHGHTSRLSAADAVEHVGLIVGRGDLAEGRERRADLVNSAH